MRINSPHHPAASLPSLLFHCPTAGVAPGSIKTRVYSTKKYPAVGRGSIHSGRNPHGGASGSKKLLGAGDGFKMAKHNLVFYLVSTNKKN